MRASTNAALGLAAYSVFLIAKIPAAWIGAQLQATFPGRVAVTDASGTLWQGKARVQVSPGRGTVVTLDHVDWRFVPAPLLRGEIAFQVQAGITNFSGAARVARGFSAWRVESMKADGDASALATFVPLLGAWRPAGPVTLAIPEAVLRGQEARGELQLEWRDATTALSEVRPLGSYRATWKGETGPGRIEVATVRGPLRIIGKGTTTPGLRVAFSGEARGEGEQAKALEPLLDLMGPRRPDGARALELRLD